MLGCLNDGVNLMLYDAELRAGQTIKILFVLTRINEYTINDKFPLMMQSLLLLRGSQIEWWMLLLCFLADSKTTTTAEQSGAQVPQNLKIWLIPSVLSVVYNTLGETK